MKNNIVKLSRRLKGNSPKHLPLKGFTSSAVLVPMVPKGKGFQVLYTCRTHRVRDHKNQISFPGGVREKTDSTLVETALRESEEEIGLAPAQVDILGRLHDLYTPTGYRITPVVGLIAPPLQLSPNPLEIEEIFQVPLTHLMNPRYMAVQKAEFFGRDFDLPFFRYHHRLIWGATGRITRELVELLS